MIPFTVSSTTWGNNQGLTTLTNAWGTDFYYVTYSANSASTRITLGTAALTTPFRSSEVERLYRKWEKLSRSVQEFLKRLEESALRGPYWPRPVEERCPPRTPPMPIRAAAPSPYVLFQGMTRAPRRGALSLRYRQAKSRSRRAKKAWIR